MGEQGAGVSGGVPGDDRRPMAVAGRWRLVGESWRSPNVMRSRSVWARACGVAGNGWPPQMLASGASGRYGVWDRRVRTLQRQFAF